MSFPEVCPNCGAPSSPSVGVCHYCRTPFVDLKKNGKAASPLAGAVSEMQRELGEGDFTAALLRYRSLSEDEAAQRDVQFLMTGVQILIEVEAGWSETRGVLGKVLAIEPHHSEARDLVEIVNAKRQIAAGGGLPAERVIESILQRNSQQNFVHFHALFTLGTTAFWDHGDALRAIAYLERAVEVKPKHLRSWGCLAAAYLKLENKPLAHRALTKCIEIETSPPMRDFFRRQRDQISV